MSNSNMLISLSLFFFFISFASSSFLNVTHKCSPQQTLDLLLFKQNMSSTNYSDDYIDQKCQDWLGSGYHPIMMNWNKNTDCCKWDGITCNHLTGDVIGIDLSCGMLQGTIHPNTSLFHLPHLQTLNLAFNDFSYSQQLPREIGRLSNTLTHLNLSNCLFTGDVSVDFLILPKLVSLDLSLNDGLQIQPSVLKNLLRNSTHLRELLLSDVKIGWVLPTFLNISSSLKSLGLQSSGLKGKLPDNIFSLQHLEKLDLSDNDYLSGSLPKVNTSKKIPLKQLDLSWTNLSGEIPDSVGHLKSLNYLDLSNCGLVGSLPNSLLNLRRLTTLDLSYNELNGTLPSFLFTLPFIEKIDFSWNNGITGPLPKVNTSNNIPLKWLDLSHTNISGEIPDSVRHFKSLNYLSLSNCSLVGSLPKSIVNLRHLTTLDLSYNELNGTLPSFLFTLPFIENIILHNNMFSGGLPSEFFNCRSLKKLSLWNNQFDGNANGGSTPPSFIQLTNLTDLDLSNNNFKGLWDLNTLLSSLPNLQSLLLSFSGLTVVSSNGTSYVNPELWELGLASCKLTVFPESLRAMKILKWLDLSDNGIHGRIPDWAGEIGGNQLSILDLSNNFITGLPQVQWDGIEYLYLQSNQIQGPFPPSICNMSSLQDLDISNNSFSGLIPQCLGNISSSLEYLYLNVKSNQLQGPFPPSICNMSRLRSLDLSNNRFDGVLPPCLGNISSSLAMIDMGNNHFHGLIPNVYNKCGALEGLILNGNHLQGEVPRSLYKCQSLKVLDLGNNQLNGTFPGWLGDLPMLQVLVFKSNNFHGPIETSSTNKSVFSSMLVLDLSHNGFSGHLPQKYIQNFNAMKNAVQDSTTPSYLYMGGKYYSITTAVKGVDLEFPVISVDYKIVDLSNNRFEGEIPGVIGSLTSLIVLDLSHNNLTGQIPSVLGNLSEIESLDLSCNQLTGEIPQSLAGLTFLGFLNLSQNHLVGRIPSGTQFSTFGNSFGGNPELCGLPLPKKCEHPHETQPEVDGDEESGFTWRVVMLGFGCGTVIGIVMGYVMLSTGRPKWFNAIADAGEDMIRTRQNRRRYIYIGK